MRKLLGLLVCTSLVAVLGIGATGCNKDKDKKPAVKEKVADKVKEKVTDKVSDKVTDKVSDKISDKVSDKITDKVTDKVTDKKPVDADKKPVDADKKPVDADKKPTTDKKPADADKKPADADKKPATDKKPADADKKTRHRQEDRRIVQSGCDRIPLRPANSRNQSPRRALLGAAHRALLGLIEHSIPLAFATCCGSLVSPPDRQYGLPVS